MPRLQLVFEAAPDRPLLIGPRQYMVEFPRPHSGGKVGRYYCLAVFDNGGGGTVIGASILRYRETVFDLEASTITFVDADCGSITPQTSYLRDAFSFSSCGKAGGGARGGGKGGGGARHHNGTARRAEKRHARLHGARQRRHSMRE
uniref:Peptidase A1 domain-containing protein n=2 Tax=Emiliania huxleyi TaxID=2903 RepID=A0A6V2NXU9_EMIHU|mmetsp:Transcript_40760/g.131091  ORF Transcript_40760/g.131091 Transcript_40760/m.131091 type:complete len:146 (+) Transcript_40760:308-745(+)